jgi:hypothetical protein
MMRGKDAEPIYTFHNMVEIANIENFINTCKLNKTE